MSADVLTLLPEPHFDDWTSALGGIGSFRDKHVGTTFARRRRLPQGQIDALYEQNALAARIVDLLVDDALSDGWEFEYVDGVQDLVALKERVERELGLTSALIDAAKWSRKDGFSLLTIPTDAKPLFPIELGEPSTVHRLAVEPRRSVQPDKTDDSIGSPTYKQTTYYRVTTFGGEQVYMHASHCVAFEPIRLPPEQLQENGGDGMGPSVLDRLFDALSRYGGSHSYAQAILYVASLIVAHFKGYAADYNKPGGKAALARKAKAMRRDMDALGILFLDEHDKIENVSHTLTGVIEILDKVIAALAAAAGIPREILFSEAPNGLRGGELSGARAIWNKQVANYRANVLAPAIEKILRVAFRVWGISCSFKIKWPPLWEPDEKELAENASKLALADQAWHSIGSVSGDEIRTDRFVNGNRGMLSVEPLAPAKPFELDPIEGEPAVESEPSTPADEAMNGAQIASLLGILEKMNDGVITYTQAIGALGVAFPTLRGREASVLGPPPVAPIARAAVPPAGPPVPDVNAPAGPPPSAGPLPGDARPVREAAAAYGVPTRAVTRLIDKGLLGYWGFGARKVVSMAELEKAAKAHEQEVESASGEPDDEGAESGEL